MRISFRSSTSPAALAAYSALSERYGDAPVTQAEVIVALGGDGFMLQTLHEPQSLGLPVYGMTNRLPHQQLVEWRAGVIHRGNQRQTGRMRKHFRVRIRFDLRNGVRFDKQNAVEIAGFQPHQLRHRLDDDFQF